MEKAENSILASKENEIKRLKILLDKKNEKITKLSSPVKRNNNGNFSVNIGAVRKLDFSMKSSRNKTPVTTDIMPSDISKSAFNPKIIRLDNVSPIVSMPISEDGEQSRDSIGPELLKTVPSTSSQSPSVDLEVQHHIQSSPPRKVSSRGFTPIKDLLNENTDKITSKPNPPKIVNVSRSLDLPIEEPRGIFSDSIDSLHPSEFSAFSKIDDDPFENIENINILQENFQESRRFQNSRSMSCPTVPDKNFGDKQSFVIGKSNLKTLERFQGDVWPISGKILPKRPIPKKRNLPNILVNKKRRLSGNPHM